MSDLNLRITLELLTAALQREANLRHALEAIQHIARKERFNINVLTSDPPMNELGMDLWRMAKNALEKTPAIPVETLVGDMTSNLSSRK